VSPFLVIRRGEAAGYSLEFSTAGHVLAMLLPRQIFQFLYILDI
jgi:hypothetical protein